MGKIVEQPGVIAGVGAGMKKAIISIMEERKRQDGKWGEQNHAPIVWAAILGEEVGELSQAILETHFDNGPEERAKGGHENMRAEAVQVAAVAEAFIEYLDRFEAVQFTAAYFNAPESFQACPDLPIKPEYKNLGGCV